MPLDLTYDSDDDETQQTERKTSNNNKAPSLSDTVAFPETLGGAPVEMGDVPNFASYASRFGGQDVDISNKPAQVARKPPTRLPRVRDIYKSRDVASKPLSNCWTMYMDEGIQGPEKQAECESHICGTVTSMKEFFPVWNGAHCAAAVEPGSNIRFFKTGLHTSPSVLDNMLEQGGKWSIPVSKDISRAMYEELALYLLDERLGETIVGSVFAIRDEVDMLQVWLKQSPNPDTIARMQAEIISLMGLPEDLTLDFVLHGSAFKKSNQVKKYFLVEPPFRGMPIDSQATSLKPRSRIEIDTSERKAKKKAKKVAKKGDEGFIDVQHSRKPSKGGDDNKAGVGNTANHSSSVSSANPFGSIAFGDDNDFKKKGDEKEAQSDSKGFKFNTKKGQKSNSRRSSKKEQKQRGSDDYDVLLDPPMNPLPVNIPLPIFMGVGAFISLLLAMAVYTYTQGSTQ